FVLNDQSTSSSSPLSTDRAGDLRRQIEQYQSGIIEQQRSLVRAPEEHLRVTALRNAAALARWLDELRVGAQRLESEVRAQYTEQEQLRALQEVGAAINSSLDLDVVLQQVMDAIIRLTKAERAMLLLDSGNGLEVKMARNLSQET